MHSKTEKARDRVGASLSCSPTFDAGFDIANVTDNLYSHEYVALCQTVIILLSCVHVITTRIIVMWADFSTQCGCTIPTVPERMSLTQLRMVVQSSGLQLGGPALVPDMMYRILDIFNPSNARLLAATAAGATPTR